MYINYVICSKDHKVYIALAAYTLQESQYSTTGKMDRPKYNSDLLCKCQSDCNTHTHTQVNDTSEQQRRCNTRRTFINLY